MSKLIDHSLGYVPAYLRKDGKPGFISIDSHSGGYPYFTDSFDRIYSAEEASLRAGGIVEMKTYAGSSEVRFETVQVVEVRVKTASEIGLESAVQAALLAKAKQTFTVDQLATLKKIL